jgi:Flp pilus assembly protein TadG
LSEIKNSAPHAQNGVSDRVWLKARTIVQRSNVQIPIRAMRRILRGFLRDRAGSPAVEFALISPLLFALMLGIVQVGIVFNNYVELIDGVRAGSRNLAISRSSAVTTPYTTSTAAVTSSAMNLTAASITITLKVNGVACASDSACTTALSTAAGDPAEVLATYPCNLTIMGVNYSPSCTLSSQSTERIE